VNLQKKKKGDEPCLGYWERKEGNNLRSAAPEHSSILSEMGRRLDVNELGETRGEATEVRKGDITRTAGPKKPGRRGSFLRSRLGSLIKACVTLFSMEGKSGGRGEKGEVSAW